MSVNILNDDKIRWFKQRISVSLEIQTEIFDQCFIETLETARTAGINREKLSYFVSDKCPVGSSLFFSIDKFNENVESNVLIYLFSFSFLFFTS